MGTQDQWCQLLHLAFHDEGVYLAREVVVVADGGAQYRKAGMTIGSGAIESVHKWVIQARCKQAGMAWSEQGINAMLRLRCVWASGRWDEIFALTKGADGKLFSDSVIEVAA